MGPCKGVGFRGMEVEVERGLVHCGRMGWEWARRLRVAVANPNSAFHLFTFLSKAKIDGKSNISRVTQGCMQRAFEKFGHPRTNAAVI